MGDTVAAEKEPHGENAGLLTEPLAFGPYTLVRRLGHGGGATVFLAARAGAQGNVELVVLKRLHEHLNEDPASRAAFLDEAELMARFDHPGIAAILETGDADGRAYFAMEYLEGRDLSRVVARVDALGESIPRPVAARIVADALDALHYAHELPAEDGRPLSIVHRDVSPQNIFVTAEGRVKLLDFGIAKARLRSTQTSTGIVKGKFAYIAPEQARGLAVDRRADLWSMGVVLWELLVGERLFAATNEFATLSGATTGLVPRLADTLPDVDPALDAVATKALAREPSARYASAAEMRDALLAYLAREPASADDVRAFFMRTFGTSFVEDQQLRARFSTPGLTPDVKHAQKRERPRARPSSFRRAIPVTLVGLALFASIFFALRTRDEGEAREVVAPEAAPGAPRIDRVDTSPSSPAPSREVEAAQVVVQAPHDAPPPPPMRLPGTQANTRADAAVQARIVDAGTPPAVVEEMAVAPGALDLVTVPWSNVSVAGRDLGTTPVLGHALPPGRYEVVFENPDLSLRRTLHVEVRSGEVTRVRIRLTD